MFTTTPFVREICGRTNDGKVYALNGSAKRASHNDHPSARLRRSGWMIRNGAGLKISYGDFITQGSIICEKK